MRFIRYGLICFLILLQYSFWFGKNNVFDFYSFKETVQKIKNENILLKEENQNLFKEIKGLIDDPIVIEEKARFELNMIKNDEHFYRIIKE